MSATASAARVRAYAEAVASGEVLAGKPVRDCCARHLRDLERDDVRFDAARAARGIDWFETVLKHGEGQFDGKPFLLHESQAFIVGSIFGWVDVASGHRRFRRVYLEMGKGGGKSPLLAGIGLYCLLVDGEKGAQVYAAAATREQASVVFQDAVRMVAASPLLDARLHRRGRNPVQQLSHMRSQSVFRTVSKTAGTTGSGHRPSCVLVDELHEHPDRKVLDILERGFKFRRQPLLVIATNAGHDRTSVCYEEHAHALAVCSGDVEDDTTFGYVACLDEGEDPLEDEACWAKANPLLDEIIDVEYLRKQVVQARAIPGRANNILRLHFCVWTDAISNWMPISTWEAVEDAGVTEEAMRGRRCWLGVDLSMTSDLSAIAVLSEDGQDEEGRRRYAATVRAYIPAEGLRDKETADHKPYREWVEGGWLTATPGPKVRLEIVARDLVEIAGLQHVEVMAYDQYLFDRVEMILGELGVYLPVMKHPQGVSRGKDTPLMMPSSINALETLVLERRIRVSPSPVIRSAVSCAAMYETAGGLRRFDKGKSLGRDDAAVALAMASGAAEGDVLVRSPWDDPDWGREKQGG